MIYSVPAIVSLEEDLTLPEGMGAWFTLPIDEKSTAVLLEGDFLHTKAIRNGTVDNIWIRYLGTDGGAICSQVSGTAGITLPTGSVLLVLSSRDGEAMLSKVQQKIDGEWRDVEEG